MSEVQLQAITSVIPTDDATTIIIAHRKVVFAPGCILAVGDETPITSQDQKIGLLAFARCFSCEIECTAVQKLKDLDDLRPNLPYKT